MEVYTLELVRGLDNADSTTGLLFIGKDFECYTLEDTWNHPKIFGKTRIPKGEYEIKLRTEGGMTKKYESKFPFHKGMLWLQNVPGFEYVYIHIGNTEDHTDGCILVGKSLSSNKADQFVGSSTDAYTILYKKILMQLELGNKVTIKVR